MKILITGSNGFIGKNLQVYLAQRQDVELLLFDLPQTTDDLKMLANQADFVFHFAGVNRPQDSEEFYTGNRDLTRALVEMLERENRHIPVVLSSSVWAIRDYPYGISKKEAEDIVFAYSKKADAPTYVYRFPHVFGRWCKPNYNSVVATFCYNVVNNIPLRVDDPDVELTLIYIDDVVRDFERILEGHIVPKADGFIEYPCYHKVTLGWLAETITGFADSAQALDISNPLLKKLYTTFISYFKR